MYTTVYYFTEDQLSEILTGNKEVSLWYQELMEVLPRYDINTKYRVAAFLAQTAHESALYTRLTENLNYSSKGLAKTWPSRYAINGQPNQLALSLHRKPEQIANHVYANRLGNGPSESGDGWKFRGKGLIQLTGRENVTKFAEAMGMAVDDASHYLETKKGAIESAAWFWNKNNLNDLADQKAITLMSKRINGGFIGLAERIALFNKITEIFNKSITS